MSEDELLSVYNIIFYSTWRKQLNVLWCDDAEALTNSIVNDKLGSVV